MKFIVKKISILSLGANCDLRVSITTSSTSAVVVGEDKTKTTPNHAKHEERQRSTLKKRVSDFDCNFSLFKTLKAWTRKERLIAEVFCVEKVEIV